jgi:hypothetical protein
MIERERELGERVRCAVERLSGVRRGASLGFALDVGRIVVDTLYAGDVSRWRARRRKDTALRALSRRPDLPLSASALYRALALYELSQRDGREGWPELGVSHLRAVLGLPAPTQSALLAAAARERWTVARLEQEAAARRSPARPRGGRKPMAPYIRSIRRIVQLTSPAALEGLERCGELDATQLDELSRQLGRARAQLERLQHVLPKKRARAACAPRASTG